MKMNPDTLPFVLQLQQDRAATAERLARQHQHAAGDPKLAPLDQLKHRLRAARMGCLARWLAKGFMFQPWMLSRQFPGLPPEVYGPDLPRARTRGQLTADQQQALRDWHALFPSGRPFSPWRAPYSPLAPPQVQSGDYTDVSRPRRDRKRALERLAGGKPTAKNREYKTAAEIRAILRAQQPAAPMGRRKAMKKLAAQGAQQPDELPPLEKLYTLPPPPDWAKDLPIHHPLENHPDARPPTGGQRP